MSALVETMAYAGELPWHGLGTKVPSDLTPEQMLEVAGLDWEVEARDMFVTDGNGEQVMVPKKKALYRASDDKFFSVIGDDWKPLQNTQAFEFFDDFVQAGDMEMHTAGSLQGGSRVWALAKVNDAFEVFKGDVIEQFLLFSNPHMYGASIDIKMTPTRVVCANTLHFALQGATDYAVKVNHRQKFDGDIVKEQLGVAKEKLAMYKEAAQFLGSKRFTNDNIVEYFNSMFPRTSNRKDAENAQSKNSEEAMEHLYTQPGAEFGAGTWWNAFNTVTYMTDHTIGRNNDSRLTSAWYGANSKLKAKALKSAIEYAEAA
jgi:phage/plasmid-like protein (TIGR03299 family)